MKCISALLVSAACLCAQDGARTAVPSPAPARHRAGGSSPFGPGSSASSLPRQTGSRGIGDAGPFGNGSFVLGQAARLVIGQTTFTSGDPNPSDTILGGMSGVAFAGDTLFVADSNRVGALPSNNRVLLFKGASSMFPGPTAALQNNSKCPVCVGQATVVLGQPDFTTTTVNFNATASSLRNPTAVASDGVHVVVADTDHNRVLIWNSIPTTNNQPADVVVGQPNFTSTAPSASTPNAKSLRAPQGVWIQNGRLYIADTLDARVLIYNRIPTVNGAAADLVLGAPNFTTYVAPDLAGAATPTASTMVDPVSVTSDGVRLFVSDLGNNRVLIWNSIPSSNGAPADVALGQPDMVSNAPNHGFDLNTTTLVESPVLCPTQTGADSSGNPTYNALCSSTINFPRFVISTGSQLFVADGGNDRLMVYNQMPTKNGAPADFIIGQIGGNVDQATNAADSLSTPMSMAWDGVNLYVADIYNHRITVYSPGLTTVPYQGVTNSASVNVTASGSVTLGGTIQANDVVTVTIGTVNYTYTIKATDSVVDVVQALVNIINASNSGNGDPSLIATLDLADSRMVLTARQPGAAGNDISLTATVSTGATITTTYSTPTGGNDAAKVAPGTIVTIQGTSMTAGTASADTSKNQLPTTLAGTTVYFDGIPAPLFYVSPTQINAQIPWEVQDSTSINAYVRSVLPDGSVQVTTPVAVTIVHANPGIYTQPGTTPPMAVAYHGSSYANALVSIDGTPTVGDNVAITIQDRTYTYIVQSGDTLDSIRDNLIALINQSDPVVVAHATSAYDRIVIQARIQGPVGNGIAISASGSVNGSEVVTAFSNALCCANIKGAPITNDNPAAPGEFIELYATGLGLPVFTDAITGLLQTGQQWPANAPETTPSQAVSGLIAVGSSGQNTADVISATLIPGSVGVFKIVLHLYSTVPANLHTPLTIAQNSFISNVAYLPIGGVGSQ